MCVWCGDRITGYGHNVSPLCTPFMRLDVAMVAILCVSSKHALFSKINVTGIFKIQKEQKNKNKK